MAKESKMAKTPTEQLNFQQQVDRVAAFIVEASKKAPEKTQKYMPYLQKAAPYLAMVVVGVRVALPHVFVVYQLIVKMMAKLPENLLHSMLGFVMCFFGGIFPATIAAGEAFKQCGGDTAMEGIKGINTQMDKYRRASEADDAKDDNKDGVPDVQQMSDMDYAKRKALLAVRVVDPEELKVQLALLWSAWVAVLAVLKLEFAKAVALGAAIGEKLYDAAQKYVEPSLMHITHEEYQKWVPVVLQWICKAIAISIAWWIQRIISAVHSAIRGGLMFGEGVVNELYSRGILKKDAEHSYIDDVIGWGLAVLGLLVQFSLGFRAPFPLNFLFFPVSVFEGVLIWSMGS